MIFDTMFGSVNEMKKGLNASWLRNEVTTNNIANADTPNFKASKVNFEDLYRAEIEGTGMLKATKTNSGHIDFQGIDGEAQIVQDNDTTMRMDGNNVDIDSEMATLAQNQIYYNLLIQKTNKQLARLRLAITEGR